MATLLHTLNTAVTLAPRAQEIYPNHDGRALGYLSAAWAQVTTAYAELAETARPVVRNTRRSLSGYPFTEVPPRGRSPGHR